MDNNFEIGENYQWVKGDNIGDVEIIKECVDLMVYFESGRSIFKSVLGEFLLPMDGGEIIDDADLKKIYNFNSTIDLANNTPTIISENKPKDVTTLSEIDEKTKAIITTFKKSADKTNNSINLELELNGLPELSVIKMMYDIFDEIDVNNALTYFLEQNIQQIIKKITNKILDKDV